MSLRSAGLLSLPLSFSCRSSWKAPADASSCDPCGKVGVKVKVFVDMCVVLMHSATSSPHHMKEVGGKCTLVVQESAPGVRQMRVRITLLNDT